MLNILPIIEKKLPELLANRNIWKSVFVDYHEPFVERLWTNIEYEGVNYRIYLHRILPCDIGQCLFHPHPWPSVMKILSGQYKMHVGYGKGMNEPEIAATLILPNNTVYEMINPDAWHAVSPIKEASYSLMITGEPWERQSHKSTKTLNKLSEQQENEILQFFQIKYN